MASSTVGTYSEARVGLDLACEHLISLQDQAGWWRGEVTSSAESLQLSLQFIANCVSIIPHMLQLAQDHADMLLCKVAGAVTRKGYLYMVFLKVPVPRLLPSHTDSIAD